MYALYVNGIEYIQGDVSLITDLIKVMAGSSENSATFEMRPL